MVGDWSPLEKRISRALALVEVHSSRPEVEVCVLVVLVLVELVLAELIEAIVWEEFIHLSRHSAANIRSELILSLSEDIFGLLSDFCESILFILTLFTALFV